jgi:hypothetical protein
MIEPKVIRRVTTRAVITDKTGRNYEGLQLGHAERCGNNELDGIPFYLTTDAKLWSDDQMALFGKYIRGADAAVDYAVWEVTHGDNEQYKTVVYPGDLILFVDGKIIPIIGEQVNLLFDVTTYQVEIPVEPDPEQHVDKAT